MSDLRAVMLGLLIGTGLILLGIVVLVLMALWPPMCVIYPATVLAWGIWALSRAP